MLFLGRDPEGVLMDTMDSFEGAASDTLQAGALAVGATSIALAAKDITSNQREKITEQEKYFKADGMDKLMGAAKKQAAKDLRTKKPTLTAEQRERADRNRREALAKAAARRAAAQGGAPAAAGAEEEEWMAAMQGAAAPEEEEYDGARRRASDRAASDTRAHSSHPPLLPLCRR